MSNVTGKLIGSLFKLGKQAVEGAVNYVDRLANRQEFDAVVAACVLVASADGKTDEVERQTTIVQAGAHPSLKGFAAAEVQAAFKECHELLGMDRTMGVETLLSRVGKITDMTARTRIVGIAVAIANADGDFSETEKAMVERIRSAK